MVGKMSIIKKIGNMKKADIKRFVYFGIVGGFGTILNTFILYLLTSISSIHYLIASGIATEIAIISNFIGNNYLTFNDKGLDKTLAHKFLSFQLISLVTLFGTIFFLWIFVTLFGKNLLLVWNILAIVIMFVANFALNSMYTWKSKIVDVVNNNHNN